MNPSRSKAQTMDLQPCLPFHWSCGWILGLTPYRLTLKYPKPPNPLTTRNPKPQALTSTFLYRRMPQTLLEKRGAHVLPELWSSVRRLMLSQCLQGSRQGAGLGLGKSQGGTGVRLRQGLRLRRRLRPRPRGRLRLALVVITTADALHAASPRTSPPFPGYPSFLYCTFLEATTRVCANN